MPQSERLAITARSLSKNFVRGIRFILYSPAKLSNRRKRFVVFLWGCQGHIGRNEKYLISSCSEQQNQRLEQMRMRGCIISQLNRFSSSVRVSEQQRGRSSRSVNVNLRGLVSFHFLLESFCWLVRWARWWPVSQGVLSTSVPE